ncbi:hypothetical protein L1Q27_27830, partial [Klebsiella pneumoniae]
MHGQRIGYVRVSSFDQNPERQLEQIQVDKVFTDKASGKGTVAKLAMRQPFVLFKGLTFQKLCLPGAF